MRNHGQYIGGVELDPAGKGIERVSPASGLAVARFPDGTREDVDLAVEAARAAFDDGPWRRTSGMQRAEVLN